MTRIVYLHGFASSPLSSKAQFFRRRFAERGIEIAIPRLDEGDFEGTTVAKQLAVVHREVAGAPAILMGSSLGGFLAAAYAAGHSNIEKLVLMAPALSFATAFRARFAAEQIERWKFEGSLPFFHYGENREARLGYAFLEDSSTPRSVDFQQPALLLHGTRDDVVPASVSRDFAAAHRNARLRLLESGHELTDVTELLWQEVSTFMMEKQ
jgi:pimeloyl-ACP methyl ester carboxylesterase